LLRTDSTEFAKKFAWAFDIGLYAIAQRIRLGKFGPLYYDPQYNKACKIVHDYLEPIVERAITRNRILSREKMSEVGFDNERYVFLEALTKQDTSPTEIRDQALNIRKFLILFTPLKLLILNFSKSLRQEIQPRLS